MKRILLIISVIMLFGEVLLAQQTGCPKNPDPLYDRNETQQKFADNLNKQMSRVAGSGFRIKNDKPLWFGIFDLTDPSNKSFGAKCVNFIDGHIYHFSPIYFDQSGSSIAILQSGTIKFFEEINCGDIDRKLKEVIDYVKQISGKYNITDETIQRVANYRRYGGWLDIYYSLRCEISTQLPKDNESSYKRSTVFRNMRTVLKKYVPKSFTDYLSIYSVENERGIGFYIQDLVDLDNKQTNLLEFVHFKEGHIYQFGWIDAPYSISHFAILINGKIHFFEAIDCKPRELKELINFIEENFEDGKEKSDLIERVNNYKKYRVAIKFENKIEPQCK